MDLAETRSRIVDAPPGEGGFAEACRRFAAALAAERPTRLGLLVDRDGTPDRWNSVRGLLLNRGLEAPVQPSALGIRLETAWGRVGVWLMPDNISSGDLETFLEGLVPQPPPATWGHAQTATEEASRLGAPFKKAHERKARLHTWLAWNDPRPSLWHVDASGSTGNAVCRRRCLRRVVRVAFRLKTSSARRSPPRRMRGCAASATQCTVDRKGTA